MLGYLSYAEAVQLAKPVTSGWTNCFRYLTFGQMHSFQFDA